MATSGSSNFTLTAADVVKDALILIGVTHPEEVLESNTQNYALDALNKMIKAWGSQGAKLWALEEAALIFEKDRIKYTFDDKANAGAYLGTGIIAANLTQTTFSADEAAAQTVLSVTSSTGMTASDQILMELDDGSRDDTTIVSVDSATQITVTTSLSSIASSGNFIYSFTGTTDEIKHPEQIHNVRIRKSGGTEIVITRLSRQEYYELNDKDSEGTPYTYYFDKQLANPVIYLWPEPDNLKETLRFDYLKTLEDIDATTDNFYFPDEWLEALTFNLAMRLAPAFGKEAKLQVIVPLAQKFLDDAMRADEEDVSTNFRPEMPR